MTILFSLLIQNEINPKENHKILLETIAKLLHVVTLDDWYSISKEDMYTNGGRELLQFFYEDSNIKALQSIYPEHEWLLWKFKYISHSSLNSPEVRSKMLDWLAKVLNITKLEDWNRVSVEQLSKLKIHVRTSIEWEKILTQIYPDYIWNFKIRT